MTTIAILCAHCSLYKEEELGAKCKHYPKQIPPGIIRGERICRKIIPIEGSEEIVKMITRKGTRTRKETD